MTALEQQKPATGIDPATQMGAVSLSVADLDRSLAFYTQSMGYTLLERTSGGAILGAGGVPLLILQHVPGLEPWPTNGVTGLYHFATLVPSRADLGRWLINYVQQGNEVPGQGDHYVSEALYLSDPDGHGIEVYRDRPRSEWRWSNGQVQMGTGPVDIAGVVGAAQAEDVTWSGLPAGTRIGHMHLQVGDIAKAAAFYNGVLGFDIVAQMGTALFVSAGGYHHHIGLNTWHSKGGVPAPDSVAKLRWYTMELPSEEARQAVLDRVTQAGGEIVQAGAFPAIRDPWQNVIVLHIGALSVTQAASLPS